MKIMILGAGPHQVPMIKRAVDLGYEVLTVDNNSKSPGHAFSNQFINCSTTDKIGVLHAARKFQIHGIATCASDVATSSVAYVSCEMGLNGPGVQAALTMSNKALFRKFQSENGFNSPRFLQMKSLNGFEDALKDFNYPAILKPSDTSGSRGICKVEKYDKEALRRCFGYSQSFSRSGTVCVEEYLEGVEVGGDGFLIDGRLFSVFTHKHKKGFIPIGHSLPTNISFKDQVETRNELQTICAALGYLNGPVNYDVMVSSKGSTVIEMSPRLGGNGIPMIIKQSTGMDLLELTVKAALGEMVQLSDQPEIRTCSGAYIMGHEKGGILVSRAPLNEIKVKIPEIIAYEIYYDIGMHIPPFAHSGNALGYVLFEYELESQYTDIVSKFNNALGLTVKPGV